MGDLKVFKGKDTVELQLENINKQFVPMKICVNFTMHFFILLNISIDMRNLNAKTSIHRLIICQESGIWKGKMSSRRLL